MKKHFFVGAGAVLMTTIGWCQPALVKDIGTAPAGIFENGVPTAVDKFIEAGDLLYFPVSDHKGKELWRTDGTSEGTFRVIDINKGLPDSYKFGAALGTSFIFVSTESMLYKTAGTESTTQLAGEPRVFDTRADVRDLWVVRDGAVLVGVYEARILLYRYKTDGTFSLIREIVNDPDLSLGLSATVGTNRVFVLQSSDGFGYESEIWITDGTDAGTKKIAIYDDMIHSLTTHGNDVLIENSQQVSKVSIPSGAITPLHDFSSSIDKLFSFSDTKSFITTTEGVWVTDGTAPNTIELSADVVEVEQVFAAGNKAYFMGHNLVDDKYNLYESDGTVVGTKIISEVRDAFETPYLVDRSQIGILNDKIIVPITNPQVGMEIASVAASEQTVIKDINPGAVGSNPQMFQAFKNKIFFVADDGTNGLEVWSTDGTDAGTQLLKNSVEGTVRGVTSKDIFSFKDELYFSASPGSIDNVWKTTNHGTDAEEFFFTNSGNILGTANDTIYMITNPMMIYKSAGDDTEPILVQDLSESVGLAQYPSENFSLGEKFVFNLFTLGIETPYGQELWTIDWRTPGAQLLKDINTGLNDGVLGAPYGASKRIYKIDETKAVFAADDGVNGEELWITDGTTAGTMLLKDIKPGSASSNPREMSASLNGFVYFVANYGEIWSTDGTPAGTKALMYPSTVVSNMVRMDNEVYATFESSIAELYKVTEEPVKVRMLSPGANDAVALNHTLYVSTHDRLWFSDGVGEPSTTYAEVSNPSNLYVFGDQVYFRANGQLWHSKGTAATTRMAADIDPIKFMQVGDLLYIVASSKEYGIELFKTGFQKFSQDITFEVADKTTTDAPFQLTATSTSGLPVTFEVVSGGVTINGSTATIVSAGSVTIKAKQAGDDTFDAAEVSTTFMVDLATGLGEDVASLKIYPNPVEKELFVTTPGHLRILDSSGREVFNNIVSESVDLSSLSKGLYIAIVDNKPTKLIKK